MTLEVNFESSCASLMRGRGKGFSRKFPTLGEVKIMLRDCERFDRQPIGRRDALKCNRPRNRGEGTGGYFAEAAGVR